MRNFKNQPVTLSILLLLFASFSAAAGGILSSDDVIWKSGPNQYVRYAPIDDKKAGPNDHPATLDPKRIAEVLAALRFRSDDFFASDDDLKPVFAVQQAQRLGQELAKGLRNAKPDQDIVFVLFKTVSKLLILEDQAYMAGRAFYRDGQLNIILGAYDVYTNDAYEKLYDSSGQLSPYSMNHGRRDKSTVKLASNLINMDGVQNKVINNNVRQDWFVIDVDKAFAALEAEKRNRAAQQGGDGALARQMRLEAARMQKEQRELKLEMARMRKEMRENSGGAGAQSVEERLSALEKLYNQDLISKEEYETKRQEILSDI